MIWGDGFVDVVVGTWKVRNSFHFLEEIISFHYFFLSL